MTKLSRLIGCFLAINGLLSASACSSSDDDSATGGASGGGGTSGSGGMGGTGGLISPDCESFPSLAMGDTSFKVTVADVPSCAVVPATHTCDQADFAHGSSPAITWTGAPTGTKSFAFVFKDLAVIARTDPTSADYNKGFHYVMWDIPAATTSLPADMMGGYMSTDVTGARQWSNFNNYGFFGPCPNYDPTMPPMYNDTYAFTIYALPDEHSVIPAQQMGVSTVRLMDDEFKMKALAVAESRGTSAAHANNIPAGVLPPMPTPPCATDGSTPADPCLGP
jgi:phosphatidylethanolamine-binding protein (PEBP) family uncharacterized protein